MKYLLLFLLLTFCLGPVSAQHQFTINNQRSEIKIEGTSTLHDWYALVDTIQGKTELVLAEKTIQVIRKTWVSIPVHSIKGEKNGMNEEIYKVLKTDEHPMIVVQLTESKIVNQNNVHFTAQLTIAGITKTLSGESEISVLESGIKVEGSFGIQLSEFDISPPKVLFGTIKVDDFIQLYYSLLFENE